MSLSLLALALFLGSLITFLFPIFFLLIMDWYFVPVEEKNLEKIFGRKYLEYKERVRRWL